MKPPSGYIPKSCRKVLTAEQTVQLVPLTLVSRLPEALIQKAADDEDRVWLALSRRDSLNNASAVLLSSRLMRKK
ncbi:MAG: hypothetical protein Q7U98_05365 [Methylicorpusculum sp.]|uniref:hypothetical protein n=1 Tax=Methylicorpusculum sp. TaxID=2713644 RepID=UPI00271BA4B1|nr:hypothetical protein [Methylicorpusculum sp.]MDO8844038.1 hypothetical protein [Methylicorpusculum sp.]MDO8938567.1 hypothetical protein [Methylicorpusculum sp.]MDP2180792.1 hypothetical protein [Methylicorpusculum sp.]MDP3529960.1 hypothetical protein [Methylicorpusculum sp.]